MCEAKWSYTTKQTGNNLKQERFQQVVYKAYTSYRTSNYTSTNTTTSTNILNTVFAIVYHNKYTGCMHSLHLPA